MGKHIKFNPKKLKELKTINDKNLLAYYQAERQRFNRSSYRYSCECCGEFYWELYSGYEKLKNDYKMRKGYLKLIKTELNSRAHIER